MAPIVEGLKALSVEGRKQMVVGQALDTPWKVRNELWRWLAYPGVRLLFAMNGIPWGRGWRFHGVPIIQKHRRSRMSFGPGLGLRSSVRSNPLAPTHPVVLTTWQEGAHLEIGADFAMTGGTICVAERIIIGNNVTVGANTTITDTDFHSLDLKQRRSESSGGRTAAIVIEDDVFIGMNCLILKGVRIGRGSVIGAGGVLTMDVPPHSIVAGNPATLVREL
jgi:acetyltransferase-like isoleucine patch superfamily enzyme